MAFSEPIINFENYRVYEAPKSVFYIPNFINNDEEHDVLQKLYAAPKPKWVMLSNRRLQNWGGLPHQKGMIAEPIPSWLQKKMAQVDLLHPFGDTTKLANHVLVNEYLSGQGIMPHVDGPLFYPTITTINLESHTVLDLYKSSNDEKDPETTNEEEEYCTKMKLTKIGSLLLEPRSLLILQEKCYTHLLHGIEERQEDLLDETIFNLDKTNYSIGDSLTRKTRVSLTIRHFPKVLKTTIFGKRR